MVPHFLDETMENPWSMAQGCFIVKTQLDQKNGPSVIFNTNLFSKKKFENMASLFYLFTYLFLLFLSLIQGSFFGFFFFHCIFFICFFGASFAPFINNHTS